MKKEKPQGLSRRGAVLLGAQAALMGAACSKAKPTRFDKTEPNSEAKSALRKSPILSTKALPRAGEPWPTIDPFLFCVHHDDRYPKANAAFGPEASLEGRNLGSDFSGRDGYSMYHGRRVPGFPAHPHRGFETVTVVRRGLLDHSDSLGAKARYGEGDVQWLTAGAGIQHAEMFPLLREDIDNPVELFQIWLNLPSQRKMAAPHFSMLWSPQIPRFEVEDPRGKRAQVTLRAGQFSGRKAPPPPPASWAADPANGVRILEIVLRQGASLTLPEAAPGTRRMVYFFRGSRAILEAQGAELAHLSEHSALELHADLAVTLASEEQDEAEFLILEGAPILEPVARRGPFVMNTMREIQEAYRDYQRTSFGEWPHGDSDPVHGKSPVRFAERPGHPRETPT